MLDLAAIVAEIAAEMAAAPDRGAPASYIPPLAAVDPQRFGIAVVTAGGETIVAGDGDEAFSIQSISKVFALTLALGAVGDQLWKRVGREPSGSAFNSIVQLETEHGIPRNPFINAGAIVLADVNLAGHQPREAIGELMQFVRYAAAGRYLMLGGRHPDGGRVIPAGRARRILSLMLTCGHYDASGDFAFRVGIPGKSGVGGGILAVVPGRASIAVWSPGLNASGNSQLGTRALEMLAAETGWSIFSARR